MEELLQVLERQIKALIKQRDQIKSTNRQLHHSKYLTVCENELLLAKQQQAISQIEILVAKLKAIEK